MGQRENAAREATQGQAVITAADRARVAKEIKRIDKAIEVAYRRLAEGREINIMKIGALFAMARARIAGGLTVEAATQAAIDAFCEAAK